MSEAARATPTSGPAPDADALARLVRLFAARGCRMVDPPVLHPVRTFVDLAGEDFRRRLFTTVDALGEELALRPDFTIPVALMHLSATDRPGETADYAYCGPVFRQRRQQGRAEFLQAGVEWIGRAASPETDAALVALAHEVARTLGLPPLRLRIGDADLFAGLVDRLPLAASARGRLKRAFGDPERLARLVADLADPETARRNGGGTLAGLSAALSRLDPAEARRIVRAVVDLSSATPFGGRSADEIADRLLERGDAGDPAVAAGAASIVSDYLSIACGAPEGPARLAAFADRHRLDLSAEVERLSGLLAALAGAGIEVAAARFEAGFGRRLDYYTGLVFELDDPSAPGQGQLVGGGRYDRLLGLLGAAEPVPAIGFAVWLDRLGESGGASR